MTQLNAICIDWPFLSSKKTFARKKREWEQRDKRKRRKKRKRRENKVSEIRREKRNRTKKEIKKMRFLFSGLQTQKQSVLLVSFLSPLKN